MTGDRATATATFRFFGTTNDFLPAARRNRAFRHSFRGMPSVKDRIETLGIPHTEIAHIRVDDSFCGFEERLAGGETVEVYAPDDIASPLADRPPLNAIPDGEPRFVVDVNLGRLSRMLRLLGFDTLYRNDYRDDQVASISAQEDRILLTRDRRLLMRREIRHGYFVRGVEPGGQAPEVIRRFGLNALARPFCRCSRCNGLVRSVSKSDVLPRLEPRTRIYYDSFWQCSECGQVYWEGSHMDGLAQMVASMKAPSA